jgi:hypothetical protein
VNFFQNRIAPLVKIAHILPGIVSILFRAYLSGTTTLERSFVFSPPKGGSGTRLRGVHRFESDGRVCGMSV